MESVPGSDAAAPTPMTTRPDDKDVGCRGNGSDDRSRTKDDDPGQKNLLAPEEVADGAEAQHEAGESEGVTVYHPLQLTHRCVQTTLDVGQDDRDDGVVQECQEQNEEQSRQGQ